MKKVIASVLALTMTMALLAGCGAKSEKSEGGEGLTVKILNNKESLCLAPVHIAIINGYFDIILIVAGNADCYNLVIFF